MYGRCCQRKWWGLKLILLSPVASPLNKQHSEQFFPRSSGSRTVPQGLGHLSSLLGKFFQLGPFWPSLGLPLQGPWVSGQPSPPPTPHQGPWVASKQGSALTVPSGGGRGEGHGRKREYVAWDSKWGQQRESEKAAIPRIISIK